jgi:hypothetical protein
VPGSMAALIESEAVFETRAKAMGLTQDVINAAKLKGWKTLGSFAFACAYTPGVGSDDAFKAEVLTPLLGDEQDPRRTQAAGVRRLFFEAYTLVAADLRSKVERGPDSDTPRKLPQPERNVRRLRIVAELQGLEIEGPLEPGNCVVDAAVSMVEDNMVRYMAWNECITREQELNNHKKDKSWKSGSDGVIRETVENAKVEADISSDLRLLQALTRRGLALDLGGAMSFKVHDTLVRLLIREHQRVPPKGFAHLTYEQLERADREVFRRLGEECRTGIQPTETGDKPLDKALPPILLEATFRMLLQPMMRAGADTKDHLPPPPPPNTEPTALKPHKEGEPKKKKAKKDKKKQKGTQPAPKGLAGHTKTPAGKPICFAFNTEGQGCSSDSCAREHVCMKCFKAHPLHKHPKMKKR